MTDQRDGSDDSLEALDDGAELLPRLDADAGPARPLSESELTLFAARIEQQYLGQQGSKQQGSLPAPRRSRRVPGRLVLVAATLAVSAAAAVYGVVVLQSEPSHEDTPPRPSAPSPMPPASPSSAPNIPVPHDAPPSDAPSRADVERLDGPGGEASERPAKLNPLPGAPKTIARSNSVRSHSPADDRLAAANALRGERRYREAIGAYLQVIELDPNGMPAAVARVAAAELRLEQFGDITGAEQLYRQAKTRGGELTAEAQFGLAQVYRARAETARERSALEEFVARHPESPLVAAARRRLQALGAP